MHRRENVEGEPGGPAAFGIQPSYLSKVATVLVTVGWS